MSDGLIVGFSVFIGVLIGVGVFLLVKCSCMGRSVEEMKQRLHDLEVKAFMDDDDAPL